MHVELHNGAIFSELLQSKAEHTEVLHMYTGKCRQRYEGSFVLREQKIKGGRSYPIVKEGMLNSRVYRD